jgi:hypothetical protein
MSDSPIGTTGQPVVYRPDASNPVLVALLRRTLGEEGWTLKRLSDAFRWHRDPEWLAGVTNLAQEMGLTAPIQPKAKRPIKQPSEYDDGPLVLPVMLRPQAPQPPKIIKLTDRRAPTPWITGGTDDGRYLGKQGCTNTKKVMRRQGWTFPPLAACRAKWEQRFPAWKWRNTALSEWQFEESDDADDAPEAEKAVNGAETGPFRPGEEPKF